MRRNQITVTYQTLERRPSGAVFAFQAFMEARKFESVRGLTHASSTRR